MLGVFPILFLALGTMSLPTLADDTDKLCLKIMTEIGLLRGKEERLAVDVKRMIDFKNSPLRRPKIVSLKPPDPRPSRALKQIIDPYHYGFLGEPSRYEETVLTLLPGDTVVFGKRRFVLGEYLGMGNTTQVFRLKDHPERVIRIPLALPETFPLVNEPVRSKHGLQRLRMRNHLAWTREYVLAQEEKVGVVGLQETDPDGRYVIVNYIPHSKTGFDLLSEESSGYRHLMTGQWIYPDDFSASHNLAPILELLALMQRNGEVESLGEGRFRIQRSDAEQYLWGQMDTGPRWILADPER